MKVRWCYSVLIVALTILGIAFQEETQLPNQEIVMQSNGASMSSKEAQETILKVTSQLEALGADHIQVKEFNGQFSIRYYSKVEIAFVKKALSEDGNLNLVSTSAEQDQPQEFPKDEHQLSYNFDVHEIQKAKDANNFGGEATLQLPSKSDRFVNPDTSFGARVLETKQKAIIEYVAYVTAKSCALLLDTTSYKIPEVRAGPMA